MRKTTEKSICGKCFPLYVRIMTIFALLKNITGRINMTMSVCLSLALSPILDF
jgi:hypothetical protein